MKKKHGLAKDNPLISYLDQKFETNKKVVVSNKQKLIPITTHTCNDPKVLLINPPMCIPVGQPKRCIPPAAIA